MPAISRPELSVALLVESKAFRADDARWRAHVVRLKQDLSHEVHTRTESVPVPGKKFVLETFILALGTSGAIAGAVAIIKTWLNRDRSRSVTLSWKVNGHAQKLSLDADRMSDKTTREILVKALETIKAQRATGSGSAVVKTAKSMPSDVKRKGTHAG